MPKPNAPVVPPEEAVLRAASLAELKMHWLAAFGVQLGHLRRDMLVRALLWRRQVEEHGDINTAVAAKLAEAIAAPRAGRASGHLAPAAKPIKRYVRVWQGVTHTVDELADGFIWQGEKYRSLSAVAKAISGTHWNGPLFFGLRDRSAWASNRGKRTAPQLAALKSSSTKVAAHG